MTRPVNPYYSPGSLGWEMHVVDHSESYSFDMLVFWRTQDGLVFMASDSG